MFYQVKSGLLKKKNDKILIQNKKNLVDFGLFLRTYWHIFKFKKQATKNNCSVAFFPGGINFSGFQRSAVINLNYLPFDKNEIKKFNFSIIYLRLKLLKIILISSIKKSKGVIFLTNFFKSKLNNYLNKKKTSIIGFGVEKKFFFKLKKNKKKIFNNNKPLIIAYISSIFPYKNHIRLIETINNLQRNKNLPIKLLIIGSGYKHTIKTIKNYLFKNNIKKKDIMLSGFLNDKNLMSLLKGNIDLKIFPSSCEAFPNILLECGASGLPILCHNGEPYKEIFKKNILYFDYQKKNDLENKILKLFNNNNLRNIYSLKIRKYVKNFSWRDCSDKTFLFLKKL